MTLSALGFVQYIGPTIMLLLSVFVFKGSVSPVLLIGFALIWTALVVYGAASVRGTKIAKAADGKGVPVPSNRNMRSSR
ncbi:hypothetical protein VQ056_04600 [Paenibacillus sp. JTLBN-2024]